MEGNQPGLTDPIVLFDRHASRYAELFMDVTNYAGSLDFLLKSLHIRQLYVLDVGCGPANLSAYLFRKNPSLRIWGVDAAPSMIALARQRLPEAGFEVADIRNLPPFSFTFDLVVLGFVAPYLSPTELDSLLGNLSKSLPVGSWVYLSTMEAEQVCSGIVSNSYGEQTIQHFYSEEYLTGLFLKFNLQIKHTQRIPIIPSGGNSENDICLIAQKVE